MPLPLLLGAYATMPTERPQAEELYTRIHQRKLATALEIPDFSVRGTSPEDLKWLAQQIQGRYTHSVITCIPTTMSTQNKLPGFGLASPSPDGRAAALAFIQKVRQAAEELNQLTGEESISALQIHSAPTLTADLDQFKTSLAELTSTSWTTRLVIEHCDALNRDYPGEKRFLPLEDEVEAANEAGLGITINWGRSVVETHRAETPEEHLRYVIDNGTLEGIMFSGAGAGQTAYGPDWGDAHLPLSEQEPASWMTPERVRTCWEIAKPHARYAGIKIQTPADKSVDERLDFVEAIADLMK